MPMDSIFDYEHPFVCTDAAVFTIKTQEPDSYRKLPETGLRVLLYKRDTDPYKDKWCLPGGFLNIDELPEDNIRRKLFAKTDVEKCRLEQLNTFCDLSRDPRARVISIAYLGLMNEAESERFGGKAIWCEVKFDAGKQPAFKNNGLELSGSDFGFDHHNIIRIALERLQSEIFRTDAIFSLMPEEFTLTELQNAFEAILGKRDQSANFRRKIMDMVRETDRYTKDKGHRPAKLFTKREEGSK